MLPDSSKITIINNAALVEQFLNEIIITPKHLLSTWARITNQTPAAKIGYIGQHLASLITGVKGTGSGARGDDLADGSEVKSCNKVDQADKCNDCGGRVLRFETKCSKCGSTDITRKDDSKWLFSVRSEDELNQYLQLNRVVLILMDYPRFYENNFNDVRISVFEIYPTENRMKVFGELISNHYRNIYRPKADNGQKTNPMNLHPWSFQFYKCNPIKTFECIISDIDNTAKIGITKFIDPTAERDSRMETEPMPTSLLKKGEWETLLNTADFNSIKPLLVHQETAKEALIKMSTEDKAKELPFINEELRNLIPLRDIVSVTQATQYHRT
ncbi:MAG: MamI family restriction endonuclease [Prevotella sp.]|nr:MamI family restriction endonuclease [Prevotella sp.]